MVAPSKRPLRVFICHASADKPAARALYRHLIDGGVDAWLDQENLLPGQDWQEEIPKAVRNSDIILVCLSNHSIGKEGYVQREIRLALDVADEKPEGTIFIIPARLEECNLPTRLSKYQWVDLFAKDGYHRLVRALTLRAETIGLEPPPPQKKRSPRISSPSSKGNETNKLFNEAIGLNLRGDAERALQLYRRVKEIDPYHPGIDLEIRKLEEEMQKGYFDRDGRVSVDQYGRIPVEKHQKPRRIPVSLALAILLTCIGISTLFTPMLAQYLPRTPVFVTDTSTSYSPVHTPTRSIVNTETISPPTTLTPDAVEPIFITITQVQPSSGEWVHPDSSQCLWTNASGQGAYIDLTLAGESTVSKLRISLFDPFVRRIRLTFSDNSQQIKDLDEIADYAFQDVSLEPVVTSTIRVEVLEVQDNAFGNFGICHVEVFGTKPALLDIFPQIGDGREYFFYFEDKLSLLSHEIVTNEECTYSEPYGLQFNYNMQIPDDFAGWALDWSTTSVGHFDASAFKTFVFWVRGINGGERLQVVFYDAPDEGETIKIHELAPITTTWRQITLPLTQFNNVNLSAIHHLDFAFFGEDGVGSICIDDIAFVP